MDDVDGKLRAANSKRTHRTSFDHYCFLLGGIPPEHEWMQLVAATIDLWIKKIEGLGEPARLSELLKLVEYKDRAQRTWWVEFERYNTAWRSANKGERGFLLTRLKICERFVEFIFRAMLRVCELLWEECQRLGIDAKPVLRMRQEYALCVHNTLATEKTQYGEFLAKRDSVMREAIKPFMHEGLLPITAFEETLRLLARRAADRNAGAGADSTAAASLEPAGENATFSGDSKPANAGEWEPVDLDQIAHIVHRRKASLQKHYLGTGKMPSLRVQGMGGRKSLWHWPEIRPWLIEAFSMPELPERFPTLRQRV